MDGCRRHGLQAARVGVGRQFARRSRNANASKPPRSAWKSAPLADSRDRRSCNIPQRSGLGRPEGANGKTRLLD